MQFGPLAKTLGLVMLTKPQIIPSIFKQVITELIIPVLRKKIKELRILFFIFL